MAKKHQWLLRVFANDDVTQLTNSGKYRCHSTRAKISLLLGDTLGGHAQSGGTVAAVVIGVNAEARAI